MTYVDERIVDMEFNNKQFETAAAQTMNTLDALKEKLTFKNASSGVDQLQRAVNGINVNPVLQGIEGIEYRMSTLGIAGKRVVENIVDIAMSGIHKIYNKLQTPLNQIITGGKSRAQNIEQAKFQLEGLGVAWDDIQEDINYGVQDTAYGLDAAAKVASQLVASQVELGDEMKHALLGISGVAAMTNSSYEDIGRIYTTVAGNGRLMGEQLLQLSSRGINAAAQLAKAMNTTEADIRDMVSKGKISFQMFSDAMFESFGEHAKEANKTFSGALSNTKAALSRLGADIAAQGFNSIRDILNEIIPKLKEFKKRIKPIEDGIIRLIDVVGKLVEEFVKAIDIEKIVDRIIPKMTSFIETAVDWVTAYKQVFTGQDAAVRGGTAFYYEQQALNGLTDSVKDATDAQMKLTDVTEDQIRIANEIWYQGLHGTGDARREELGKDYEAVQYYIEQMIELGWDEAKMQEKVAKAAEEEQQAIENLAKTEKKREFITKITSALQNLKTVAKNVATSVKNVLSVAFSSFGKAINASNGATGIVGFTGALASLSEKFKITEERAEKLRPIFEGIHKVVKTVWKVIKTVAKGLVTVVKTIKEAVSNFMQTDIFNTVSTNVSKGANKIIDTVKGIINSIKKSGIITTFTNIAKTFVTKGSGFLGEFIKNISGTIYKLVSNAGNFIGAIVDFASGALGKVIDVLKHPIGAILDLFGNIITSLNMFDVGQLGLFLVFFKTIFAVFKIFKTADKAVNSVLEIPIAVSKFFKECAKVPASISGFFTSWSKVAKAKADQMKVESFKMILDVIKEIVLTIIALTVVMAAIPNADKLAWQALAIVSIITILIGTISIISDKIENSNTKKNKGLSVTINTQKAQLGLLFTGVALMISTMVKGIATLYKILSSSEYDATSFVASISLVLGITAIVSALVLAITYGLSKVKAKDTYSWRKTGLTEISVLLVAFAISLKLVISAINDVYEMVKQSSNMNRFTAIMGFVVALYGVIAALVFMLAKFKKIKGMMTLSVLFLSFAVSFKIITSSLQTIMDVANSMESYDNFMTVMSQLITVIGVLGFIMAVLIGVMSTSKSIKTGPLIGMAAVFLALSAVLKSIGNVFTTMTKAQKQNGSTSMSDALNALVDVLFIIGLVLSVLTALNKDVKGLGSMLGLSAIFVSLAIMLSAIASSVAKLAEVPSDNLYDILTSVGEFIIILTTLTTILAMIMKGGSTLTMLGITAAILALSVAISILGATFRSINKEMGADVFKTLALTMGIFVGAIIALVVAMTYLTGPLGMASLLGLAAMFVGIGVGLYFAGKGVNYLLDAFERFVGYISKAVTVIVDVFSKVKNAISNLFSRGGWGEKGFGDKDKADENGVYHATTTYTTVDESVYTMSPKDAENYKKQAEDAAETVADYQYVSYKAKYYEELNKKSTEDPVVFSPNPDIETSEEYAKERDELVSQIAADDAEQTYNNYNDSLQNTMDNLENTDASSFWDPSSFYDDIQAVNMGDGLDFDLSGWQDAYDGEVEGMDFSGTLTDSLQSMFGEDGDLASLMSSSGTTSGDDLINNLVGALNGGSSDITSAVGYTMDDVTAAMAAKTTDVEAAAKVVPETALETAYSYENEFYKAGVMLYTGFAEGLTDKVPKELAEKNMADVVFNMETALKKTAIIKSPSKRFAKLGNFVTLGFAEGILQLSGAAETATEDVAKDSTDSLREVLDRIFDTTMSGLDTNPKITPVLDLSELEEGLGQMDGMLAANNTFGLAFGAARSYNTTLAARNAATDISEPYDGSNVVEAVNDLKTDVDEMKVLIGNLGFYVDGKQMATAMANPMSKALNDISVRTGRGVQ